MILRLLGRALLAFLVLPLVSSVRAQSPAPIASAALDRSRARRVEGDRRHAQSASRSSAPPAAPHASMRSRASARRSCRSSCPTSPHSSWMGNSPCAFPSVRRNSSTGWGSTSSPSSSAAASRRCTSITSAAPTTGALTRPCRSTSPAPGTACWSTRLATSRCTPVAPSGRDSKNPPVVRDRNLDRRWSSQPTSDAVEVLVPAAGATVYLFAGPTPLDAVRRYNLYSGGGVLPPKWGLGFLHRVPTLFTARQAARRSRRVREARLSARRARARARVAERVVSRHVRLGQHALPRSHRVRRHASRAETCA